MTRTLKTMCHCRMKEPLEKRLACLADAGPAAITERLNHIDSEWSAGRITKAVIGVAIIVGMVLAASLNWWWLIMPSIGGLLLLQYLFGRTSWLGLLFQRLGFHSGEELDREKMALKAIRGDFRHLPTVLEIENKEDISRLEGEGGIVLDMEDAKPDAQEVARDAIQAART